MNRSSPSTNELQQRGRRLREHWRGGARGEATPPTRQAGIGTKENEKLKHLS